MSEQETVSVREPLEFPLTKEQLRFLANPWQVDPETIFYALYNDTFRFARNSLKACLVVGKQGINLGPVADVANSAIQDLKAGRYLGESIGLPAPKDGIFWDKSEIDEVKLKRGTSLFKEAIANEPGVGQAWGMYRAELVCKVRLDIVFSTRTEIAMVDMGSSDPELYQLRYEQNSTNTGQVLFDLDTLAQFKQDFENKWLQNEAVSEADMNAWFSNRNSSRMDQIKSLQEEAQSKTKIIKEKLAKYVEKLKSTTNQDETKDQKGIPSTMASEPKQSTELTSTEPKTKKTVEFKNVSVMYVNDPSNPKISLPQGMSYAQAREWLTKIETEENRKFAFMYKFKGWYPFDAMWAVYRALAELYGFVHVGDFKTMFGPVPPASITIETDYDTKQQIPWGPIEVHGLSAQLIPNIDFDQGLPVLSLHAEIKNHERAKVDELMTLAEKTLKVSSIYRGKAVEIDFTIFKPGDIRFDVTRAPKFMDTNVKETDLILPGTVKDLVETAIWTPVRNAQVCREHKIPLRRGILLAGRYGVGKTLAARVTAMLCEQNHWTFLYLKDLDQLPQALYFAKRYEPCVVFAEDINRVVTGDRTSEMDKLFNVVDGIDRKNDEVMIIFTTNDLEQIHPGMLRPGRIDSVITVTPPDATAAEGLVRHYGRTIVDPAADLTAVGKMLQGQIPAIIREAVERSKLSAIKDTAPGQQLVVRETHLMIAARQMLEHAKLLEEPASEKPDVVLGLEALGKIIANGMRYQHGVHDDDDDSKSWDKTLVKEAVEQSMDDAGRPNGTQS
jgi:hypothetical protein